MKLCTDLCFQKVPLSDLSMKLVFFLFSAWIVLLGGKHATLHLRDTKASADKTAVAAGSKNGAGDSNPPPTRRSQVAQATSSPPTRRRCDRGRGRR
jgi:hypothetical protein